MAEEEKKPGFLRGNWVTIILVVVFVVLAVVLYLILRDPEQFDRFRKRRETKPQPLKPEVRQQYYNPQFSLESIDSRLVMRDA